MSDLVERLRGRARFLRDRKRIKSPELMEEAIARITELETALAEAGEQLRKSAETLGQVPDAIADACNAALEEAAKVAYVTCALTRHVHLGDKCAQAIRDMKDRT